MRKDKENPLDAQIAVRITSVLYGCLERLSRMLGKTKSDLVREAAEEKVKEWLDKSS